MRAEAGLIPIGWRPSAKVMTELLAAYDICVQDVDKMVDYCRRRQLMRNNWTLFAKRFFEWLAGRGLVARRLTPAYAPPSPIKLADDDISHAQMTAEEAHKALLIAREPPPSKPIAGAMNDGRTRMKPAENKARALDVLAFLNAIPG